MISISNIFNIPENYTLKQLKKSFIKIIEDLSKSDKTDIEKKILVEQYTKFYKHGKYLYMKKNSINNINSFDNISKNNLNTKSQIYSYTSSYQSKLNSDGSKTIIETKSKLENGNETKTINAYKKMPSGEIIPFSKDEMKRISN